MKSAERRNLLRLAELFGIETSYLDVSGRRRSAAPEALLATLRALGCPIERVSEISGALSARREAIRGRLCDPVSVAWADKGASLALRVPGAVAGGSVSCRLILEGGESRRWRARLAGIRTETGARPGGRRPVSAKIALPSGLPQGYHRIRIELAGREIETRLIVAPRQAWFPSGKAARRRWGVFLPLYALASRRSWGSGDFTDLERLARWTAKLGGSFVGTPPILAAFLDDNFEASPYAPASCLFWNEFYIDVARVPELAQCEAARRLVAGTRLQRELDALRKNPLVDYRRGMALKRKVLSKLAAHFFRHGRPGRVRSFERYLEANPLLPDYARFRAASERRRISWDRWPARMRDGDLRRGDYDEKACRYHLYVQWIADAQLGRAAANVQARRAGLYLDLPLGAGAGSYDVWRERRAFALGVSAGAPPDPFFVKGQNWGFPPFHPEAVREQGYRYFIAALRHHLRHSAMLRIDHVMRLHRLFWVPSGFEASEGVYVRYRPDEFYAILALESHRAGAVIAGENLGTVPPEVNAAMAGHDVQRLYVLQYDLPASPRARPGRVPERAIAGLNTHDMPTFAGFLTGRDIGEREESGFLGRRAAAAERANRRRTRRALARFLAREGHLGSETDAPADLLRACLAFLAASPARAVQINLEDLWGEPSPQNVPGTGRERPNWRRKAALMLEEFSKSRTVLANLAVVATERRKVGEKGKT